MHRHHLINDLINYSSGGSHRHEKQWNCATLWQQINVNTTTTTTRECKWRNRARFEMLRSRCMHECTVYGRTADTYTCQHCNIDHIDITSVELHKAYIKWMILRIWFVHNGTLYIPHSYRSKHPIECKFISFQPISLFRCDFVFFFAGWIISSRGKAIEHWLSSAQLATFYVHLNEITNFDKKIM